MIGSNTYEKCAIVNENNWSCGNAQYEFDEDGNYNINVVGMNNGVYFSIYESYILPNRELKFKGMESKHYYCAK